MTDFSNYCLGGVNSSFGNCIAFVGEWMHHNKIEAAGATIFLAIVTGVATIGIKKAVQSCLNNPGENQCNNFRAMGKDDLKGTSTSIKPQTSTTVQTSSRENSKKLDTKPELLNNSFANENPTEPLFAAKFYEAIFNKNNQLLETVAKHQLDITKPLNGKKLSPLQFACTLGDKSVVDALIKIGRIENLEELIKCCESAIDDGQHTILQALLSTEAFKTMCAKLSEPTDFPIGLLLLKKAALKYSESSSVHNPNDPRWQIFAELVAHNKDQINTQHPISGNTMLHELATTGNAAIIKELIGNGANTSLINAKGETPFAIYTLHAGNSANFSLAFDLTPKTLSSIKKPSTYTIDPQQLDKFFVPAIESENFEQVEKILELAESKGLDLTKYLLKSALACNKTQTPNQGKIFSAILEKVTPQQLNAPEPFIFSVLATNNLSIIEALIKAGADVSVKNTHGITPKEHYSSIFEIENQRIPKIVKLLTPKENLKKPNLLVCTESLKFPTVIQLPSSDPCIETEITNLGKFYVTIQKAGNFDDFKKYGLKNFDITAKYSSSAQKLTEYHFSPFETVIGSDKPNEKIIVKLVDEGKIGNENYILDAIKTQIERKNTKSLNIVLNQPKILEIIIKHEKQTELTQLALQQQFKNFDISKFFESKKQSMIE